MLFLVFAIAQEYCSLLKFQLKYDTNPFIVKKILAMLIVFSNKKYFDKLFFKILPLTILPMSMACLNCFF